MFFLVEAHARILTRVAREGGDFGLTIAAVQPHHVNTMPRSIFEMLPPKETLVQMPVEELGAIVLEFFNSLPNASGEAPRGTGVQAHVIANPTDLALRQYAGETQVAIDQVARTMMEVWGWLEREGFIARSPGDWNGTEAFVTRKGRRTKSREQLEGYRHAALLNRERMDPALVEHVTPLFLRGRYETAVFEAYKEVEVRARQVAGLPAATIGVDLMRQAFHTTTGKLRDVKAAVPGELQAMSDLFAGAIGIFKNPGSHRRVPWGPEDAAAVIMFADYLLRIVESRR